MLHASFMPSSGRKREGTLCRILGALIAGMGLWFGSAFGPGSSAPAAGHPRVASINLCTDQLLLALADPDQIIGLSPFSRDRARSWAAAEAARYPRLSGEAEDVLIAKPDVVVAGRFTKRATRELLKEKGLRVVEFDVARSIDDARDQLRRMGEILGQRERAEKEIARLDAAIARARAAASHRRYSVLAVARRGWVSGDDSLTSSILSAANLTNAAHEIGFRAGGFATLELIVSSRPDLILVADGGGLAEDQGSAFLLHPALQHLYPPERRLVIPEQLTVCGGPMLADALDRLTAEIERVNR